MDRPLRDPRAPRGAPPGAQDRRRRRPDFLAPDDEADPFDGSAPRRAAPRSRGGALSPSSSVMPALPKRLAASGSQPGDPRLTLPSMPRLPRARREWSDQPAADEYATRGLPAREQDAADGDSDRDTGGGLPAMPRNARRREHSSARPLSLMRRRQVADALDALDHPPASLAAATGVARALPVPAGYPGMPPVALARPRGVRRVRVDTQRIARAARSPWNALRFAFALAAIALALLTATARMGEPAQPLMLHARWAASGGALSATPITSLVKPEIQIVQSDLYDSYQQFLDWRGAACSAATSSEVLTAWGAKNATIGQLVDKMQPDISLDGGLINEYGFQRGAAAYGYRADISHTLTYQQMLYITNQLGLPVIVNVRISYGYYHYFDTGHFLVMTGGDSQGVSIVDSSTYYIHYLPLGVFFSMFTGRTYVIVPKDYHYSVPAI